MYEIYTYKIFLLYYGIIFDPGSPGSIVAAATKSLSPDRRVRLLVYFILRSLRVRETRKVYYVSIIFFLFYSSVFLRIFRLLFLTPEKRRVRLTRDFKPSKARRTARVFSVSPPCPRRSDDNSIIDSIIASAIVF